MSTPRFLLADNEYADQGQPDHTSGFVAIPAAMLGITELVGFQAQLYAIALAQAQETHGIAQEKERLPDLFANFN